MKRRKAIIFFSWAAVAACMGVIFYLSAQNGAESQSLSERFSFFLKLGISIGFVRTCAHCLEFMGLAVLIFNALYQSFGYIRPFLAFVITAAYAASDEIHQLFVDGRACQITDFFVDCLGAAIGTAALCAMIIIFSKIKRRRFG